MNTKTLLDSLLGFEPHEHNHYFTFEFGETDEVTPCVCKVSPENKPYFKERIKEVFDIDIDGEKSVTFYQDFSKYCDFVYGHYGLYIIVGDTTRYIRQKNVLDFNVVESPAKRSIEYEEEDEDEEDEDDYDELTTVTFTKNGAYYKYERIVYCIDSDTNRSLSKCVCAKRSGCYGGGECVMGYFDYQIDYPIDDIFTEPLICETQIDFKETLEKILGGSYDLEHGETVTVEFGNTEKEVWNYKYPARATITTGDREYLAKRLKEKFGIELGDETSVAFSPDTSGWCYSLPADTYGWNYSFNRTKDYDGLYITVGTQSTNLKKYAT